MRKRILGVGMLTALGAAFAFLRTITTTGTLGATEYTDVLIAAFTWQRILLEDLGTLITFVLMPRLARVLVIDGTLAGQRIIRGCLKATFWPAMVTISISILWSEPLSRIMLPDVGGHAAQFASQAIRLVVASAPLYAVAAFLKVYLDCREQFLWPLASRALLHLAGLVSTVALAAWMQEWSAVIGILLGAILMVAMLAVAYNASRAQSRASTPTRPENVRRSPQELGVLVPILMTVLSLACQRAAGVLDLRFASGLEKGSATLLSTALMLFAAPTALIVQSGLTVLMPRLTRLHAMGDLQQYFHTALKWGLALVAACAVGGTLLTQGGTWLMQSGMPLVRLTPAQLDGLGVVLRQLGPLPVVLATQNILMAIYATRSQANWILVAAVIALGARYSFLNTGFLSSGLTKLVGSNYVYHGTFCVALASGILVRRFKSPVSKTP